MCEVWQFVSSYSLHCSALSLSLHPLSLPVNYILYTCLYCNSTLINVREVCQAFINIKVKGLDKFWHPGFFDLGNKIFAQSDTTILRDITSFGCTNQKQPLYYCPWCWCFNHIPSQQSFIVVVVFFFFELHTLQSDGYLWSRRAAA